MTAYAPQPPTRSGRPRGAKVLMVVGAVLALLAVALITLGAVVLGDGVSEIDERTDAVRTDLLVEVPIPGRDQVRLEPGRHYVYAVDPLLADTGPLGTDPTILTDGPDPNDDTFDEFDELAGPDLTFEITGPDGATVPTDLPGAGSIFDGLDDDRLDVVEEFRVTTAGTYTVTVTGGDARRLGIGRSGDITQSIGKAVGGGALIGFGFLIGTIGGVLLLAGFVWFLAGGTSSGPPSGPPPMAWGTPPPGWGQPGAGPGSTPGGWAPPPPPPGAGPIS